MQSYSKAFSFLRLLKYNISASFKSLFKSIHITVVIKKKHKYQQTRFLKKINLRLQYTSLYKFQKSYKNPIKNMETISPSNYLYKSVACEKS